MLNVYIVFKLNQPLAKSSSSFLFATVPGSLATRAGLAFACSAAWSKHRGTTLI